MPIAAYNPTPAKTAEGLPDLCYSISLEASRVIILRRGVDGYYPTDWPPFSDLQDGGAHVDRLNGRMGVTPAQRAAMEAGSAFGWDVPAADPSRYDDAGRFRAT